MCSPEPDVSCISSILLAIDLGLLHGNQNSLIGFGDSSFQVQKWKMAQESPGMTRRCRLRMNMLNRPATKGSKLCRRVPVIPAPFRVIPKEPNTAQFTRNILNEGVLGSRVGWASSVLALVKPPTEWHSGHNLAFPALGLWCRVFLGWDSGFVRFRGIRSLCFLSWP